MSQEISIKKATMIYGVAKYSTIFIQLFISAILSRLLTPNDYGIVAVVTVFTTLFTTLSNLGLGTAVTQFKDLTKADIQDIFTFSEYFSFILAFVFGVAAVPIASFYGDRIYIPIVLLLTLSVFLNSLNMIPNAILLREKQFLKVGIRMIVSTLSSGVVAIVLAFVGFKYYALVIQSILNAFITFIWNYMGSKLRFKIRFSLQPIQRVKNYSANQFFYNLANYFAQNLDNLLTGKIMGNEMLAFYNKGYTLMRYPVNNIAHVVTPVLHPILSDHQNDKQYIFHEFIRVAKMLSLIGVYITAVCFWADTEIIICYFGKQWYSAVSPFKWLSICICVQLLNALFGAIYQSLGCTKEMLQSGMVHITISLVAIIAGAFTKNITLLALFVSISMFIKFFVEVYFLVKKSFGYKMFDFLKWFLPDCVIMLALLLVMRIVGDLPGVGLLQGLIVKGSISTVVFVIMLIVTKQMHYVTGLIPSKLKRKFTRMRN